MHKAIISFAGLLLASAKFRAHYFMQRNRDVYLPNNALYRSNAGGWN